MGGWLIALGCGLAGDLSSAMTLESCGLSDWSAGESEGGSLEVSEEGLGFCFLWFPVVVVGGAHSGFGAE